MQTRCLGVLAVVAAVLLTGCISGMRGGPQSFVGKKQINEVFGDPSESIKCLRNAKADKDRNRAINDLIGAIDGRYYLFQHNLVANRKHGGAVVSGTQLLAGVLGSMTGSAGVKDNYLQLTTLLQGGQGIYDKNYMFDQTVDALISQMEASRNKQLVRIMRRMQLDLTGYPPRLAIADLTAYYQAGTLAGATRAIGVTTGIESQETDLQLLRAIPTEADIDARGAVTTRLSTLVRDLSPSDAAKLWIFIESRDPTLSRSSGNAASLKDSLTLLSHRKYLNSSLQLIKDLEAAEIPLPPEQENG